MYFCNKRLKLFFIKQQYEINSENVHNMLPSENQPGVVETGVQGIRSFRQFFLVYPNNKYDCPIQPDESPYTVRSTDTLYAEVSENRS